MNLLNLQNMTEQLTTAGFPATRNSSLPLNSVWWLNNTLLEHYEDDRKTQNDTQMSKDAPNIAGSYPGHNATPPWLIYLKDPMEVKSPHIFVPMFIPIILTHAMTFVFGVIGNSTMIASLVRGRVSRNITR